MLQYTISFEMFMCTTYTTSQDEKAMLRVFMRLQVNNTGFEMPIYRVGTSGLQNRNCIV